MQWLSALLVGVLGATALSVAPFAAGSLAAQPIVNEANQDEVAYRVIYRQARYREPYRYHYYRPYRGYYYRQDPYYPYNPYQGGVYFRVRL